MNDNQAPVAAIILSILGFIAAFVLVIVGLFGAFAMKNNFHRTQARKNANNSVLISGIEIQNQKQRVEIAKQQAEIRLQDAIGVREAQDEIAKTLTPLYVQFEMVDALKQIAQSGRNSSVVFIPSGANGIPAVYDMAGATKVGNPQGEK